MELMTIEEAAWKLRNGSVIAYPTETVYGLGAVIYDEDAVLRIKGIKQIAATKPLSIIISKNKPSMLDEVVDKFLPAAQRLSKFFWPGPLTIVHESKKDVPDYITGGTGFVGIRCSPHPIVNELLDLVGHPIISTSANPTNMPPARSYEEIFAYFKNTIDGVLIFDDDNPLENKSENIPSTIVKIDFHSIEILREGAIKKEDILRKLYE